MDEEGQRANAHVLQSFFPVPPNDRRAGVSEGKVLRTDCSTVFFLTASWTWTGAGWYGRMQHVNVLVTARTGMPSGGCSARNRALLSL